MTDIWKRATFRDAPFTLAGGAPQPRPVQQKPVAPQESAPSGGVLVACVHASRVRPPSAALIDARNAAAYANLSSHENRMGSASASENALSTLGARGTRDSEAGDGGGARSPDPVLAGSQRQQPSEPAKTNLFDQPKGPTRPQRGEAGFNPRKTVLGQVMEITLALAARIERLEAARGLR